MLLTDKDAFKHLPVECTQAIYNMSDQIAGLRLLNVELKLYQTSPQATIHSSLNNAHHGSLQSALEKITKNLDNLVIPEIQNLIDGLIKLHSSINPE